jgi:dTDP-4-dehydrorhamnose reductase
MTSADNQADSVPSDESSSSRRALFQAVAVSSSAWCLPTAAALASSSNTDIGSSPDRPVAILGAGGPTGLKVALALAEEGLYTVTMTRTGREPIQSVKLTPEVQSLIQHYPYPVSVTQKDSLKEALTKVQASAIIFCASASKKGGTAFEVDDQGVGNAAEVARDLDARFILVSALAVDRPNSKSYQITNTLGGNLDGIMDAKLQGENKVRSILSKKKDYMIIRPGVLMNGRTKNGPRDMQVNQEDQIGGGLSRDELAGVIVGALKSGKRGVTVEVYRRSTATPLQPAFTIPSGHEAQASTYVGLFDSTVPDP